MFSKWKVRRDNCNNSQCNFRSHMQRVNVMELRCPHLLRDHSYHGQLTHTLPSLLLCLEDTHHGARDARGQHTHWFLLLLYSIWTSKERDII